MSRNAVLEKKVAPKTARLPDALVPTAKAEPTVHRHNGDAAAERPADNFPEPMAKEAFHGLAGQIVKIMEPQNEINPEALLLQFLVSIGSVVGRGPCTLSARSVNSGSLVVAHHANEFLVVCGESALSRKGTSLSYVLDCVRQIDQDWRVGGGLRTGEGLVFDVRDPRPEMKKPDAGVPDKRVLYRCEEYSAVLHNIAKGMLSQHLRDSWDSRNLENRTKVDPIFATGPHISVIGHITPGELRRAFRPQDMSNGFGNRFLWCAAQGFKDVPHPQEIDWFGAHRDLIKQLRNIVQAFRGPVKIPLTPRAKDAWGDWYRKRRSQRRDIKGQLTSMELSSRCEAHVKRLALLFAILDNRRTMDLVHLNAAWAIWRYCSDSITWAFPDTNENRFVELPRVVQNRVDRLLAALRAHPEGMTRTQISNVFQGNTERSEIEEALKILRQSGLAVPVHPSKPKSPWTVV